MAALDRDDLVGRWSLEKLELLRKYLAAYLTILSKQPWCTSYEYIDLFAGTGKPRTKDEQHYVDGSPRIALALAPPFTRYHFIEQSAWRIARLHELQSEFHDRMIRIYQGDSNQILRDEILPQLSYASGSRAFAFIDPFGMQMEWETIGHIAETRTTEIIINFPVMAVNRLVRRRRPGLIPKASKELLNRLLGDQNWMEDLYAEQPTLFGPELVRRPLSAEQLATVLYTRRLEKVFAHCSDPIPMTNSRNAPLYCLIFAGHNATGRKIAQDVFRRHKERRRE